MLIRTSALAILLASASLASAAVYSGNGATGFGGGVGNSTTTVTDDGANIDFSIATTGFSGNALILYVDSVAGGVNDTSTFTDTADGGRTAISGFNSGNPSRTLATFPVGFGADYAITVEPGVFSGVFDLSTPANFGYLGSNNIAGTGPVTFSVSKAALGLPTSGDYSFSFVGTLISTTAYRSNETIGASVTVPDTGAAPNGGFNGTQVFATGNTFAVTSASLPEPSAMVLGLPALAVLRRRR